MKQVPDHHDAELIVKLYDLRREAVMRASREALLNGFYPKSFDEIKAIMSDRANPLNAPLRQVTTYFEMAYGFARHGVVHADMLAENTGEGMFLFARLRPHLAELRATFSPMMLQNAEWMANNSEVAKRQYGIFEERVKKLMAAKA